MADAIELNTDGPHSPEYTRRVAEALSQAVRVLNHGTITYRTGALEFPSDVDSVVACVEAATASLPQLLGQLRAWLQDQNAAGKIRIDHGGDPIDAVTDAGAYLLTAAGALGQAQDALHRAHQVTATMAATDD